MIKIYPKILIKATKLRKTLPVMDKPIAAHMDLQFKPKANLLLTDIPIGLSGQYSYEAMRCMQQQEAKEKEASIKAEQRQIEAETKQKEIELKNAIVKLKNLYNTYIKFVPSPENINIAMVEARGITAVKECINSLNEEIEREQMMRKLENIFTKGAAFYYPKKSNNNENEDVDPFSLDNLADIQPRVDVNIDEECARLIGLFISNSTKIDNALIAFNEISKNFQIEAAKSLKEIFALQTDSTNKCLERIPKLGIIPKILRVAEQIRLSKCIIKDYRSVSEEFVDNKLMSLIKKYNSQYKIIQEYIAQYNPYYDEQIEKNKQLIENTHWWQFKDRKKYKEQNKRLEQQKEIDKKIRDLYKQKVDVVVQQRQNVTTQGVNIFARCGMNINNICQSIQTRGIIDVVRKAVFTLISIF